MPELTQPWVNELLTALKPKKGFRLSVYENIESRAAVLSYEPPSFIAIQEKGKGWEKTIFQFEPNPYKGPTIHHCDLVRHPEIVDLVAKLSPTRQYKIEPIIREKRESGKRIEFAGSNLAELLFGD